MTDDRDAPILVRIKTAQPKTAQSKTAQSKTAHANAFRSIDHNTPADVRAMQKRWDSIITMRAALQGSALALLIATLIT